MKVEIKEQMLLRRLRPTFTPSIKWTYLNFYRVKGTKYEIKTKMEQEQWLQLKKLFLLGYNLKNVI